MVKQISLANYALIHVFSVLSFGYINSRQTHCDGSEEKQFILASELDDMSPFYLSGVK